MTCSDLPIPSMLLSLLSSGFMCYHMAASGHTELHFLGESEEQSRELENFREDLADGIGVHRGAVQQHQPSPCPKSEGQVLNYRETAQEAARSRSRCDCSAVT